MNYIRRETDQNIHKFTWTIVMAIEANTEWQSNPHHVKWQALD